MKPSEGRATLVAVQLARAYSSLSPPERRSTARRLRLEWASSRDVDHARGVERLIDDGERIDRRNGRRR